MAQLHRECAATKTLTHQIIDQEVVDMWTKPAYENIRLGFEITMYFKTR